MLENIQNSSGQHLEQPVVTPNYIRLGSWPCFEQGIGPNDIEGSQHLNCSVTVIHKS